MTKVLLTATVQSHIAQFHKPLINLLKGKDIQVDIAARDNLKEKNGLEIESVDHIYDIKFSRSPLSTDNIKAYKELKHILESNDYDVIHCNTPMGGIVTRLAARKYRKKGLKVIYTAHGFHFYKGASKKNWLIYYPIEKLFSKITDVLITITNEDYQLAKEKFNCCVKHIHGVGVNEEKYLSISQEENEIFRDSFKNRFVILCTGELNNNKNQTTIIKSIKNIIDEYPNILLLLAGNGPNEQNLINLINDLNLNNNVQLLGYRTDLERYVNACDLVVSASFREGLPLNIMEGMICKKAIIASNNRGHRELVNDGVTGYLVNPNDSQQFSRYIKELLEDKEKRITFGLNGFDKVQAFKTVNVKKELEQIYDEILKG